MTCVVTGAAASLSRKRRGRHPSFGLVYFWALAVVFLTSTVMSFPRWSDDTYLFVLGTLAFSCALVGLLARRQRWRDWTTARHAHVRRDLRDLPLVRRRAPTPTEAP